MSNSSSSWNSYIRTPPTLDDRAFHGPIGDFAQKVGPHTEASQAAILLTLLANFGAAVGNGPYVMVGDAKQTAALFAVVAGKTAKARKGTSKAVVDRVMVRLDTTNGLQIFRPPTMKGFGSGETLIDEIRDQKSEDDAEAPADRRLVIAESEFASVLRRIGRENAILGPTLRDAWDGSDLIAKSRTNGKSKASDYHLALVGHITVEELEACLSQTEIQSGTANRILWVYAERANVLPNGGNTPDWLIEDTAVRLRAALQRAASIRGPVEMSPMANSRWEEWYLETAEDDPPGIMGAVISRAEAQVLRLALIYALADSSDQIEIWHLQPAIAVWDYCRASAQMIFGNKTGNKHLDKLLKHLFVTQSQDGMTKTEISGEVFSRNLKQADLDDAILLGVQLGQLEWCKRPDTPSQCIRLTKYESTNSTNSEVAA